MDSQATPKQQVAEVLKNASSIMVTTVKNPNVDEVASAIGLTHMLQSMNKHATAVISTQLPSVLEFLNAEEMVETSTDRLRDFVITFSKEKADKLRYKVVDEDVKIFITPYKTVLTKDDLLFTQGDYNVDTVIVLGATKREALDDAVLEHSRILSDSKVLTINAGNDKTPEIGEINWHDNDASSIAEMLVSISEALASGLLTKDSSQALLTGLVSATNQFGNDHTTPKVMTMAAQLMAAGADQKTIMNAFEKQKELSVAHSQPADVANNEAESAPAEQAENNPAEPVIEFSHSGNQQSQSAAPTQPQPAPAQQVADPANEVHVEPAPAEAYGEGNNEVPGVMDVAEVVGQGNQNQHQVNVLPQPAPTNQQNPSLVITEPPKDRIVLDGATDPNQANFPQRPEPPHIRKDARPRLEEQPAEADLSDNPLLSKQANEDTSRPGLNAHDHSVDEDPRNSEPKKQAPILDHGKSSANKKQNTNKPPVKDVDVDMDEGPHIKVNPEAPVLNKSSTTSSSKPQNSKSAQPQPAPAPPPAPEQNQPTPQNNEPDNSKSNSGDPLAAARQAVEQAADSQAPTLPKPIEALNAQEMQQNDSNGEISIDHNGNIQQQG